MGPYGNRSAAERIRWRVAHLLNRNRRYCWSDLVDWALRGYWIDDDEESWAARKLPWPTSERCRTEGAQPNGSCYCGKFRDRAAYTPERGTK